MGLNASMKPFQDVTIKGEYYGYWLAKDMTDQDVTWGNWFSTVARPGQTVNTTKNGFLGQELDLTTTYDYTEDVQFNLMGGVFLPGNVFGNYGTIAGGGPVEDSSSSVASEVIGSMKVTF